MPSTSPFRTQTDLITEALANIGVLAAGQATDVEDFNYVQEKLDAIFRKLSGLEIVDVADANNIPGAWFSDLAAIVAGECAAKFGCYPDWYSVLVSAGLGGVGGVPVGAGAAALSLKAMTRGRPTYERQRAEYF